MLKYVDTAVTLREIPDEITLCINISNCPCHCKGCHSPYLAEDIGIPLTEDSLKVLIQEHPGITCVCFMGGDSSPIDIGKLANFVKQYLSLKVAWYSGKANYTNLGVVTELDYIKLGGYIEALGPLTSKKSNQKMYEVVHKEDNGFVLRDVTYKFIKDD